MSMTSEDVRDEQTTIMATLSDVEPPKEPLLNNRYLIEKEIGRGGIGVVYFARDTQLHSRPVVIKVLLRESLDNEWYKKKFYQEMEALARIDHPGVVGVFDSGEMPDGAPFLVMQFVEGATLRSVITVEGMPYEQVAHIARQIGRALSEAHSRGVCHRDLKPENIMLQALSDGEELVKIIDFGIARIKDSQVASNKETTAVAGTIAYMAPEQLYGKPLEASDVYAFGVIAYEMLTGRRPFNPDSPYNLLEMQRGGVRVLPADLRPGIPLEAQEAILKALSFDPGNRHARARDFGEDLALALIECGIIPAAATQKASQPTLRPPPEVTSTLPRRKRARLYVAIISLVVMIAFAVIAYTSLYREPAIATMAFGDDFDLFNASRWNMPPSGWSAESDGRLHIENAPIVGFPKDANYRDFVIRFHLKLTNAGGAAWAARVRDSGNYYLFYLSGPEGLFPGRFNSYIVRNNKFDARNYSDSVAALVNLSPGAEYDVEVTAFNNVIETKITPAETGQEMKLGFFKDPNNVLPYGSIGFRTVGPEQFSIDELYMLPPDAQAPK
jgi:serine/threonine protein kinase